MFWAISWFVSGYWLGKRAATPKPPTPPAKKLPSASTQADADAMYQAALGKGNGQ